MCKRFKFIDNIFCWCRHWLWSFLQFKLIVNVRTWTRNISLIPSKSLFCWFELWSSCWVYFHNDTVTVRYGFYVWFDYISWNIILSRTSFNKRFLIKKCFSHSCWVEWSWKWWFFYLIFFKILTWTDWTR